MPKFLLFVRCPVPGAMCDVTKFDSFLVVRIFVRSVKLFQKLPYLIHKAYISNSKTTKCNHLPTVLLRNEVVPIEINR